jgi:hypothetical protein
MEPRFNEFNLVLPSSGLPCHETIQRLVARSLPAIDDAMETPSLAACMQRQKTYKMIECGAEYELLHVIANQLEHIVPMAYKACIMLQSMGCMDNDMSNILECKCWLAKFADVIALVENPCTRRLVCPHTQNKNPAKLCQLWRVKLASYDPPPQEKMMFEKACSFL